MTVGSEEKDIAMGPEDTVRRYQGPPCKYLLQYLPYHTPCSTHSMEQKLPTAVRASRVLIDNFFNLIIYAILLHPPMRGTRGIFFGLNFGAEMLGLGISAEQNIPISMNQTSSLRAGPFYPTIAGLEGGFSSCRTINNITQLQKKFQLRRQLETDFGVTQNPSDNGIVS